MDTFLSNGRIVARNLPGNLATVPVDEQETYLRYNFTRSDNRNYRDGDRSSSRLFRDQDVADNNPSKNVMYNSPKHKVGKDEESDKMKREFDSSANRTTLIDDNVRVYKGGSWRDRVYWIDPSQRRYLPEYIATDYIGFRNAMSRVGSKSQKANKRPRG
ncbi:C-alpha-formylglycine-generating enzyme 1 (fragment) [Capnocytophaga canimorsus]|uniref:C-alpha-formylglycine-generating enzyme 1 n=1 Tax=Capnocytophaga canimorsus TaxID=28188 RepID=A0A0B7HEX1_9FLAO